MKKILCFARKNIDFLAIFAVFFSAFTFYITAIEGEFVFDDLPLVASDPFYHEGANSTIADCFTRQYWRKELADGLYRPLTLCTYLLNAKFAGLYSPSFRFVNITLHSILSVILYFLFLKLAKSKILAFCAVILFAVHPLHSEAVIPASGRSDLLCAIFVSLGFFVYICEFRMRTFWLFICGLFSLLSKENGIVLLPLCVLYDLIFRPCEIRKVILLKNFKLFWVYLMCIFSILIYFSMRVYFISMPFPKYTDAVFFSDNHLGFLNFWHRLPTALWLQGLAVLKFIFPVHLAHDYSYAQIIPIKEIFDLRISQMLVFVFVVIALGIFLFCENHKISFFCLCAYFLSVLPIANIIVPTGTIFGERLYYFPTVFLSLFFVLEFFFVARDLKVPIKGITIFAISLFFVLFARLLMRIEDWRDLYSLAKAGVKTSPLSFKMWNNYALQILDRGLIEEAELAFSHSLKINPSNLPALRNRAYTRIALKKYKEALEDLKSCSHLGANDVDVYNKAGALSATLGNNKDAIEFWEKSLKIKPEQKVIIEALQELKKIP